MGTAAKNNENRFEWWCNNDMLDWFKYSATGVDDIFNVVSHAANMCGMSRTRIWAGIQYQLVDNHYKRHLFGTSSPWHMRGAMAMYRLIAAGEIEGKYHSTARELKYLYDRRDKFSSDLQYTRNMQAVSGAISALLAAYEIEYGYALKWSKI